MFAIPPVIESGVERVPEGSSNDNPIVLPVNEDRFRGFLGALHPQSFLYRYGIRLINDEMLNSDLLDALSLATMCIFKEVRVFILKFYHWFAL